MLSPGCIWMNDDERLADLGALLVFRHWLRLQIEQLATETPAGTDAGCDETDGTYGRLFF